MGNVLQGVLISSASSNIIGAVPVNEYDSYSSGGGNVISGTAPTASRFSAAAIDEHGRVRLDRHYDYRGAALGNTANGVFISNASDNSLTDDVISANGVSGVLIAGGYASENTINSSLIGTDVTGSTALGNTLYGVFISNAPSNTLGSHYEGGADVISGNKTPAW